jgi:hypothetical protein
MAGGQLDGGRTTGAVGWGRRGGLGGATGRVGAASGGRPGRGRRGGQGWGRRRHCDTAASERASAHVRGKERREKREERRRMSGTIIRGTPKSPNLSW